MARVLREVGYADCSPGAPEVLAMAAEGFTANEVKAIAQQKPGKPLAYLLSTLRGKRNDLAQGSGGRGAAEAPRVDPTAKALGDADHHRQDQILQAQTRLRLELIDQAECERLVADANAKYAALRQRLRGEVPA